MPAPSIDSITPSNGFNAFPIGEQIEILFNREISSFLAENSISLVGPDNHIATGVDFEENLYRFTNESKFDKVLESLSLKGQVPVDIELFRCNSSGDLLLDGNGDYIPYSYQYDANVWTKIVIKPKSFLQEKTDYRLILSGSESPDNEWSYLGSRSIYDPFADV